MHFYGALSSKRHKVLYIKQAYLLPRFALLITNFSRKRLLKMSSRPKNAIVRLCFPFPWNSKDRYKTWHTMANTNLKNSHVHILLQTHPHTYTKRETLNFNGQPPPRLTTEVWLCEWILVFGSSGSARGST